MFFDSIEQILARLEQQPGWEKYRDYRQLLKCWNNIVSRNTAQHSRPLYIARQVLWVATSSAARAQELSFQRYSLLKKLNHQLPFTLKDIRFSTSQWHQTTEQDSIEQTLFSISSKQKSKINLTYSKVADKRAKSNNQESQGTLSPAAKAKAAAERWLETVKQNSASFPSCPKCDAPTPIGEIERWNLCYLCVAQKWSQEYRPPTFPEPK